MTYTLNRVGDNVVILEEICDKLQDAQAKSENDFYNNLAAATKRVDKDRRDTTDRLALLEDRLDNLLARLDARIETQSGFTAHLEAQWKRWDDKNEAMEKRLKPLEAHAQSIESMLYRIRAVGDPGEFPRLAQEAKRE